MRLLAKVKRTVEEGLERATRNVDGRSSSSSRVSESRNEGAPTTGVGGKEVARPSVIREEAPSEEIYCRRREGEGDEIKVFKDGGASSSKVDLPLDVDDWEDIGSEVGKNEGWVKV